MTVDQAAERRDTSKNNIVLMIKNKKLKARKINKPGTKLKIWDIAEDDLAALPPGRKRKKGAIKVRKGVREVVETFFFSRAEQRIADLTLLDVHSLVRELEGL